MSIRNFNLNDYSSNKIFLYHGGYDVIDRSPVLCGREFFINFEDLHTRNGFSLIQVYGTDSFFSSSFSSIKEMEEYLSSWKIEDFFLTPDDLWEHRFCSELFVKIKQVDYEEGIIYTEVLDSNLSRYPTQWSFSKFLFQHCLLDKGRLKTYSESYTQGYLEGHTGLRWL